MQCPPDTPMVQDDAFPSTQAPRDCPLSHTPAPTDWPPGWVFPDAVSSHWIEQAGRQVATGVAGRTIGSQRVETFWYSEVRLAFPILVPYGLSLWGTNAGHSCLLSTGKTKGVGLSEGRVLLGCLSVGKHVNSKTQTLRRHGQVNSLP